MKSWKQCFKDESQQRLDINPNDLCKYGVKALDDALKCIMPNDLVVIGADSGAGKSDLGLKIAANNAKNGKRVAMFFLEGGEIEAIARIKWVDICEEYYANYSKNGVDMDYSKWRINSLNHPCLMEIENKIWIKYKKLYKDNLDFFEVKKEFTFTDFHLELMDYFDLENNIGNYDVDKLTFDVDLIIIDHLQYFSLTQGESEISQITHILREVKQIADRYNIPVILISHLKKSYKDRGLPDQEDFYGSSNIPKISTTSIIISKDIKNDDFGSNLFPTFFRFVKSRVGLQSNYCIRVNYDLTKRTYEDKYDVHYVSERGIVNDKPIEYSKLPDWARNGSVKDRRIENESRSGKRINLYE